MQKYLTSVRRDLNERVNCRLGCQGVQDACDRYPFERTGGSKTAADKTTSAPHGAWSLDQKVNNLRVRDPLSYFSGLAANHDRIGPESHARIATRGQMGRWRGRSVRVGDGVSLRNTRSITTAAIWLRVHRHPDRHANASSRRQQEITGLRQTLKRSRVPSASAGARRQRGTHPMTRKDSLSKRATKTE